MKLEVIIDESKEEKIIVFAKKESHIIDCIRELVENDKKEVIGYNKNDFVKLNVADIYCFTTENNKIFAITEKEKFLVKNRLYKIEEQLGNDFIKINQSCIANKRKIERFSVSFGGGLTVIFKNGYKDYVSRRQLKSVKKGVGIE